MKRNYLIELKKELRALRKRTGLTQAEFAQKIRYTVRSVAAYEAPGNHALPSKEYLDRVARATARTEEEYRQIRHRLLELRVNAEFADDTFKVELVEAKRNDKRAPKAPFHRQLQNDMVTLGKTLDVISAETNIAEVRLEKILQGTKPSYEEVERLSLALGRSPIYYHMLAGTLDQEFVLAVAGNKRLQKALAGLRSTPDGLDTAAKMLELLLKTLTRTQKSESH